MKKLLMLLMVITIISVSVACSPAGQETNINVNPEVEASYVEREESTSTDVIEGFETGRDVDLENLSVACVNKAQGYYWFDCCDTEGQNWKASQDGKGTWSYFPPKTFDAAAQASALSDAIATDPDVLIVAPISGEAVNEALKPAKDAGTVTIAVEGMDTMTNIDYFLDPFHEEPFIKMHVDEIVERMGDDITYVLFVGKLTTPFQVLWCDTFYDYATETYPNMTCIVKRGEYMEHDDDEETAYEVAKQIAMAHPDVDLMWSSSAGGTLGLARAIEELGLVGDVYAGGHLGPSSSESAINAGSVIFTTIHYPGAWGYAAAELGRKVLAGEKIENGTNLGIEGFENVTVIGNHVYGDGWYLQDADTIATIREKYPLF